MDRVYIVNAHALKGNRRWWGRRLVAVLMAISILGMHPAFAMGRMPCGGDAAGMECCCETVNVAESSCCVMDEGAAPEGTSESLTRAPSMPPHQHLPLGTTECCVSEVEANAPYTWSGATTKRPLYRASVAWEERGQRDTSCPSQVSIGSGSARPFLYFSCPAYISLASLLR